MDLYHSIVFVGACIAFFAMYKVLSWFINRRYYVPKVAPPKINETYGARRSRFDALTRANLGEETMDLTQNDPRAYGGEQLAQLEHMVTRAKNHEITYGAPSRNQSVIGP